MASFKLAELFVEITAKGFAALNSGLGAVREHLDTVQRSMAQFSGGLQAAFGGAAAHITAFKNAGLQGTGIQYQLNFAMMQFNREVAALFITQMQDIIKVVRDARDWLAHLSGAQQENLGRWLAGGAAMLATAAILPKIVSAGYELIGTIRVMTTAVAAFLGGTGIGALLPLLGLAVAAFASFGIGSKIAKDGISGLVETFKPLAAAIGELLTGLGEILKPVMNVLQAHLSALVKTFTSSVKGITGSLSEIAVIGNVVAGVVDHIGKGIAVAMNIVELFKGTWLLLKSAVLLVFEAIVKGFETMFELAAKLPSKLGGDFFAGAAEKAKSLKDTLNVMRQESTASLGSTIRNFGQAGREYLAEVERQKNKPERPVSGGGHRLPEFSGGQSESITQRFARAQEAALKGEADYQKKTAEEAAKHTPLLTEIRDAVVKDKPPAIVP